MEDKVILQLMGYAFQKACRTKTDENKEDRSFRGLEY